MSNQETPLGAIVLITHKRTKQLSIVIESLEQSWVDSYIQLFVILHDSESQVKEIVESIKFISPKILNVSRDTIPTPREAISRNIFDGLSQAFLNQQIDYVTVLEDDILVRRDFLSFNSSVIAIESSREKFRGINGFSGERYNPSQEFAYSRFRYGFGWGWTITRKTWNEVKIIWASDFESHWDSAVEPYIRSGYVVMPHNSRILNLGFDASATHTLDGGLHGENLRNSFQNTTSITRHLNHTLNYTVFSLNWRQDVFSFIETDSARGKLIDCLFMMNSEKFFSHKSRFIGKSVKGKLRGMLFCVIGLLSR
jgi:hypothetical protein